MARPRLSQASETVRVQIVAPADLINNLRAWQHDNQVASLSEAIRLLSEAALRAEGY